MSLIERLDEVIEQHRFRRQHGLSMRRLPLDLAYSEAKKLMELIKEQEEQ